MKKVFSKKVTKSGKKEKKSELDCFSSKTKKGIWEINKQNYFNKNGEITKKSLNGMEIRPYKGGFCQF